MIALLWHFNSVICGLDCLHRPDLHQIFIIFTRTSIDRREAYSMTTKMFMGEGPIKITYDSVENVTFPSGSLNTEIPQHITGLTYKIG